MKYPLSLCDPDLSPAPILRGLATPPYCPDLSNHNPDLAALPVNDPRAMEDYLAGQKGESDWGLAGYMERRDPLLRHYPQMMAQKRFYHLGLDIIAPKGAAIHAPLAAQVVDLGYEEGPGNYGGYVLLLHKGRGFDSFFSFYGHLDPDSLPPRGKGLARGQDFAKIGDHHHNGGWFHHTHLQVITQEGMERGYQFKGYCAAEQVVDMPLFCPDPLPLFRAR